MIAFIAAAGLFVTHPYQPTAEYRPKCDRYFDPDYIGPGDIFHPLKQEPYAIDRVGAPGDPVNSEQETGAIGDPNEISDFIGVE